MLPTNSTELRKKHRPAHLERLNTLLDAGPNPAIDNDDPGPAGYSGSIIIAEFDSLSAVQ